MSKIEGNSNGNVTGQDGMENTFTKKKFQIFNGNKKASFIRVIHFEESVRVYIPKRASPKTVSDSSNTEKEHAVYVSRKRVNLFDHMGDIHKHCLNEWLLRLNNNDRCEICKEKYLKSNIVKSSSVICLSIKFFDRIFIAGLSPRSSNIARIRKIHFINNFNIILFVTLLIISTPIGGLTNIAMRIWHYVNKQRAIRFIDFDINKKAIKY
uniref:RING-CH-type domain-containing protein n=1 Tax=Wuchereria bancrofti TaxID=6293 RepID=A0AAF5RX08_WUCBA